MNKQNKIVVTGYTFTRKNLFEVFDFYPEKQNLFFILPNRWKAKGGKVIFKGFKKPGFNIYHSPAFFSHSNYPLFGGLFKGWMPFFVFRLIYLRIFRGVNILYTAGEPNLLATLYNAIFAKILGMKHVFLFWENIPYEKKDKGIKLKIKKWIIRMNIKLSDGGICGMHKAEEILRTFKSNFKIETFLHAGFNIERFRPDLEKTTRKEFRLENKFIFLFVGSLSYRKGIHLIAQSLKNLKDKYNNLHLILVGSGEYQDELKLLMKQLGIESMITFIPWLANEELPNIYCSSDVFLYPSIPFAGWEEQFGYSIAEASLCELPAISTKSGTINEVLQDGKTGIMIEPNNQKQLEQAMEKLILDENLGKELGKNGREYIKDNFSHQVIANKMFNFFKNL